MVELTVRDTVVLIVLLLCVPLQLWIEKYSPREHRDRMTINLVRDIQKTFKKVTSLEYWDLATKWIIISNALQYKNDEDIAFYSYLAAKELADDPEMEGECPAVEIMRHMSPLGHYSMSPYQRKYRTRMVHHYVGEVVWSKTLEKQGAIIGWDEKCKAPESVIEELYSEKTRRHASELPHYALLIDQGNGKKLVVYVSQDDLEPSRDKLEVINTKVDVYFDHHDGARYIPRPWLAALYPEDL